jgi:hypothetical protein
MTVTTIAKTTDTKHTLLRKKLQFYQNQSGAVAHNALKSTDTKRRLHVKILRAELGI